MTAPTPATPPPIPATAPMPPPPDAPTLAPTGVGPAAPDPAAGRGLARLAVGLALLLALANGVAAWAAERATVRDGVAAEAAAAADVLAAGWGAPPTAADLKAARKLLAERPGFRALVARDAQGQANGDAAAVPDAAIAAGLAGRPWRGEDQGLVGAAAPLPKGQGLVFVGLDAAPVRAAEQGALGWAVRVALLWALALLAVVWGFTGWWGRRVALLVAAAGAAARPGLAREPVRPGVFELDGLADVFTVMHAVREDAEVRRARARFAAERDRGEPEMVEAFAGELAEAGNTTVAGRVVAPGATAGAAGAFVAAGATPTGGYALAARLRMAPGLRAAVEADAARRLAAALLGAGAGPEAAWRAVVALWPLEAWDLATWGPDGAARRWTLAPGAEAPVPADAGPGALVLSTCPPALAEDLAAYAARLPGLTPAVLRDDLRDLVLGGTPAALAVLRPADA